jgi:hypothetical protein
MATLDSFSSLCETIRFPLDVPISRDGRQQSDPLGHELYKIRASSLKLDRYLLPLHFRSLVKITDRLLIDHLPDVYVVNDPSVNACVRSDDDRGVPIVLMNSGLINSFDLLEFEFVLAHELAHFGFGHDYSESVDLDPLELLAEMRLRRWAEISSDRVALVATRSLSVSSSVLLKLASGLIGPFSRETLHRFAQISNDAADDVSIFEAEDGSSHPSLAVRLWALNVFAGTQEYLGLISTGTSDVLLSDVDSQISLRLTGSTLADHGREIRRFVDLAIAWVGALIVMDDGRIDSREDEIMRDILGDKLASQILVFCRDQELSALEEKASDALFEVSKVTATERQLFEAGVAQLIIKLKPQKTRTALWHRVLIDNGFHLL